MIEHFLTQYMRLQPDKYRFRKREDISILLGQASRKVITNPRGLIKINSGNHSQSISLFGIRE